MPCPHLEIKITQRSKEQSAVAGAAYQSGDSLFSEYDQKRKSYRDKSGIVYTEIMLPKNAPPEYKDRGTLWNSVEAVENQWNAQLARRLVLALPREVPEELYPQMVREYCQEYFVSKGMCCDFAIHDPYPKGHNPHCHIMLTMRAIDEQGKWLPKSRKVYDLDENGERIRLPSGNWKSHKENTVDWNEQYHCEEWRHCWETVQNKYLEMAGSHERVDLRSYKRQGIDIVPTVHMGPAVTQMERRGIKTDTGNLNRDIREANATIRGLQNYITDLCDWRNALLNQSTRIFTQGNMKQELSRLESSVSNIRRILSMKESRMKDITAIEQAVPAIRKYKTIHDKYMSIGWKPKKQKFAEEHQSELNAYSRAERNPRRLGLSPDIPVDLKRLKEEYKKLEGEATGLRSRLEEDQPELKVLKSAKYLAEKEADLEQRQSVVERLDNVQEDDARCKDNDDRKKKKSWEAEM
ncbi:MAG: MobA/MobL family protein [Oscillospiraceae bacterium]|nr:MobA/MobL family protein [Oscillospiraceae bacterium]